VFYGQVSVQSNVMNSGTAFHQLKGSLNGLTSLRLYALTLD